MSRSISSQPEASNFRSILVIIIVLICIASFLTVTSHLAEKTEVIARERVITDIQYALSMMLYDYTINGKQRELNRFDQGNPFIPLAIYRSLPTNYHGSVASLSVQETSSGWYFDQRSKRVIYIDLNERRAEYVMSYSKDHTAAVGQLVFHSVK